MLLNVSFLKDFQIDVGSANQRARFTHQKVNRSLAKGKEGYIL